MATYLIKASCYVRGQHHTASVGQPASLTVPDDHIPSLSWEPMDAPAVEALKKRIAAKVAQMEEDAKNVATTFPTSAQRLRGEIARLKARKVVPVEMPAPAPAKKEVNTNAEMAEQRGKVVGRHSDQSPV